MDIQQKLLLRLFNNLVVFFVKCKIFVALAAETIVDILQIECHAVLDICGLGHSISLLKRLDCILEVLLELLNKSLILSVIVFIRSLLRKHHSIVVVHHTCTDESVFIIRIDFSTLVVGSLCLSLQICLFGRILSLVSQLVVDIALHIVEGSIVRLVLDCHVEQSEQLVRILVVLDIEIDQGNQNALALRELAETLLNH